MQNSRCIIFPRCSSFSENDVIIISHSSFIQIKAFKLCWQPNVVTIEEKNTSTRNCSNNVVNIVKISSIWEGTFRSTNLSRKYKSFSKVTWSYLDGFISFSLKSLAIGGFFISSYLKSSAIGGFLGSLVIGFSWSS